MPADQRGSIRKTKNRHGVRWYKPDGRCAFKPGFRTRSEARPRLLSIESEPEHGTLATFTEQ